MRQHRRPSIKIPNQEDIYRLLAEENWPALLSFVWENPSLIASDAIIKHAIDSCEEVFFPRLQAEPDKEKLISTLESFVVFHSHNKYRLSDEMFSKVVLELAKLWPTKNLEQAYQRA